MAILKKRGSKPDHISPRVRRRKKRGTAREELKKDNRTGPPADVPQFSMKAVPDERNYPTDSKEEPKYHLCPEKKFRGHHEPDMRFAGWAKGYGDGEFDVACRLCGELGRAVVKLKAKDVLWG